MTSAIESATSSLRIRAQLNSRYGVFDRSGDLPFTIVIGLCRRSSTDTDPRTLFLAIANSVLDVPYALAHGLLTLEEQGPDKPVQWIERDLISRLRNDVPDTNEYVALPSPVDRQTGWLDDYYTEHHYHVNPTSEFASVLQPGKKYRLRFASSDLRIKHWAYGDRNPFLDNNPIRSASPREPTTLVFTARGNASFTVVERLPWPPKVHTQLRWHHPSTSSPSPSSTPSSEKHAAVALEISATNLGSHACTVQTTGHQRCLFPWHCHQPVLAAWDDRPRVIHSSPRSPPTSSLILVACATGTVVKAYKTSRIRPLMASNTDLRPRGGDLVVLWPGEPVIRIVELGGWLTNLEDGEYSVRMDERKCAWWDGEVGVGEDGRLSRRLYNKAMPPLILESSDEVRVRMCDGTVVKMM